MSKSGRRLKVSLPATRKARGRRPHSPRRRRSSLGLSEPSWMSTVSDLSSTHAGLHVLLLLLFLSVCAAPHEAETNNPVDPPLWATVLRFSAELLDDPTVGEQSRRDVGRTSASSRDPHRSLPNTSSAPAEGLAMSELCMKASAHRTAALFQRFNLRSLQDGSGVLPGNTTGESLVQVNSLDEGVCEAERLPECFQVWPSMRETAPKPAAPHSQSIVVNCLKRKFSYCSYS